jgi:tripartite-type tricarboxylate transporter receptor subunit TctC
MKRFALLGFVALTAAALLVPGSAMSQDFPMKTITNVVFSSAGGGTDVMNRQLAAVMEKSMGQKMIVTNMPGGLGGTAAEHVWAQPHDGYTLLGVSETSSTFMVNNATKHGAKDWVFYIGAGSPGVMAVRTDSPIKTFDDLITAAKQKAKSVKVANSGKGKLWNIKAVILEKNAGVQFLHLPYNGSNPAIIATLSGEADVISASLQEVSEHVRAGSLRVLVLTEEERLKMKGYETVPALAEKFPAVKRYFPLQQWLGFGVPKDTPEAVVKTLGAHFEKAMKDPGLQQWMAENYLEPMGIWGEAAGKFSAKLESNLSWISYEMEIVKINPSSLGIAKPEWAP